MSSATAGIHPVAKVFLVVSNKGFLLLSVVSVTGGFDGIFERSAIGARGV